MTAPLPAAQTNPAFPSAAQYLTSDKSSFASVSAHERWPVILVCSLQSKLLQYMPRLIHFIYRLARLMICTAALPM